MNLVPIDEDYMVQEDDRVRLPVHVHERAVPDVDVPILYEDKDYLAVSKPAGLDVFMNPSGGVVRLSLLGILEAMGYEKLLPAHRIDKPVSGVLCLARNKKAISRLQRCIKRRQVQKTYVARTCAGAGEPRLGERISMPLMTVTEDGRQVARISENGKASETIIKRILERHPDGSRSVEIQLLTGRYHQIRCHLQHAGWPIVNDATYGGTKEPGPELYTGPMAIDMLRRDCTKQHCRGCQYYRRVLEGGSPFSNALSVCRCCASTSRAHNLVTQLAVRIPKPQFAL